MIEKNINDITFIAGKWPIAKDRNTIVFIHGSGDSSNFWKYQIDDLSGDINTIGIDLPGHGLSRKAGMSTVEDYSKTVDNFITETKIPNPIPCGLSLGGAITLQLLLEGRAHYQAGIVINSGAKLKVMPMIFELIQNDFQGYVNSVSAFAASEKTNKHTYNFIIENLAIIDPEIILNDFKACDRFNVMERLGEISLPVLVMTAEDDKLTPEKYGAFLNEKISGSTRVNINDAGHISPIEKPDEINREILEFIRGLK